MEREERERERDEERGMEEEVEEEESRGGRSWPGQDQLGQVGHRVVCYLSTSNPDQLLLGEREQRGREKEGRTRKQYGERISVRLKEKK